jgi:CRISPR-associated protein Csm4
MLVPETLRKSERLQRQRRVKEQMHSTWLTLEDFNRVRRGEIPLHPGAIHDEPGVIARNVTPKNQIDRITNTAGSETGALYDMEELVLPKVTLYWLVANDHSNTVKEFLTDLCKSGYGKRKAVGYGQIASFTFELFSGFDDIPDANGFVSLSRFVPAPSDPTEGYWKTAVKYGKLGEELAYSENPFKRPLLMLECGSCLYDTPIGKRYGQLLSGLSVRPEVRDYAFAFPVPISLPVDK